MRYRDGLEKLLKYDVDENALLRGANERVIWDQAVIGLGLRLRSGVKPVWIIQRRIKGRLIKRTLGRLAAMDLAEPRPCAHSVPLATASKLLTVFGDHRSRMFG